MSLGETRVIAMAPMWGQCQKWLVAYLAQHISITCFLCHSRFCPMRRKNRAEMEKYADTHACNMSSTQMTSSSEGPVSCETAVGRSHRHVFFEMVKFVTRIRQGKKKKKKNATWQVFFFFLWTTLDSTMAAVRSAFTHGNGLFAW